jgi:hypothetical protein
MKDILKKCRFCNEDLKYSFCDLGKTPLSNSYVSKENLNKKENFYPLHAYVCSKCLLVQLPEHESPENIFQEYAYFSSFSDFWLKHCEEYVNKITKDRGLTKNSFVVELASNDGYLLQYFKKKEIPCLGIEPAKNVAEKAISLAIPTITEFFGEKLALNLIKKYPKPDLIIANNVLAHVPNLNDFVKGMKELLGMKGVITIEFPHIMELIKNNQFDTIYHEHFSYFSIHTLDQVFKTHGLFIFDIEKLISHGGSLRIYVTHQNNKNKNSLRKEQILKEEKDLNLDKLDGYLFFQKKTEKVKKELLFFLHEAKKNKKKIIGYGAPAKGNTLLNFCGIKTDLLELTVDRSPHKQGKYLPGSLISIKSPEVIKELKPDYLLILPWNLKEEISTQLNFIRNWNGKFVVPIPALEVF